MTTDHLKEQLELLTHKDDSLAALRKDAYMQFEQMGIPAVKHEEWKYTRIGSLFNKEYQLALQTKTSLAEADIDNYRLPGYESANELVFVNGAYQEHLSMIRSTALSIIPLEVAAINEHKDIVSKYFNHSSNYLKDGMQAMNTAMIQGGVFISIAKKQILEHPVYIYNICDTRQAPVLSQPRSLVHVGRQAEATIVETYHTIGESDSMTNQVLETVLEEDANFSYYKIQNDTANAHQVNTTHIIQPGRSVANTVTISLDGGMVRNNLHAVLQAEYAEAHMYGLYFQQGHSHIDNHTIMDHAVPNCPSNELYKGILDGESTGVFNGKIFVRKDAQKTNAFQSNKNILLSESASVNTKPQLEIFADDVKCSHGCTVGSLDEEGLFYLQSRGIPHKAALALLLQGFAMDILEKIRLEPIREYVAQLIAERLNTQAS